MIKNLKIKFLICLFLLVTVFSVTSSCFAVDITTVVDSGYTEEEIIQMFTSKGITIPNNYILYMEGPYNYTRITLYENFAYLKKNSSDNYYYFYNSSNQKITVNGYYIDASKGSFDNYEVRTASWNKLNVTDSNIEAVSTITIYDSNMNIMYEPIGKMSVDVTHEFQSDTSAKVNFTVNNAPEGSILKYSLTGVEITTDLNAPLQLRNPITYTPRSEQFSC